MSKQPGTRLKITERALIQRINRKLAADYQKLSTARSERAEIDIGRYYVVDTYRNSIVTHHVELEPFGRELGVLQPWEALAE